MRRGTIFGLVVSMFAVVVPAADAATGAGTARGSLTVNKDKVMLAHAFARAVEGFFDKTKDDVEVVLSDVALPANGRERMMMFDQGKAHGVKLVINPNKQVVNYQIWHSGIKGAAPGGGSSAMKFEAKTLDGKTIAGKVHSSGPQEVFGVKFEFSADFEAPILPR